MEIFCGRKRESDRKCVNHARVHASAQSFDRCEGQRFEPEVAILGADQKERGLCLAYGNCACNTSGSQKLGVLPKRHDNSLPLLN